MFFIFCISYKSLEKQKNRKYLIKHILQLLERILNDFFIEVVSSVAKLACQHITLDVVKAKQVDGMPTPTKSS